MALVRDDGRRDLARWSDPAADEAERNPMGWRGVLWIGYGIVFVFFGVFGLWAALAPLGSGAVAQGQIQVIGNQRVVQHLEGGIIKEIMVSEGDRVTRGQPLVVLDGTRMQTQFDRVNQQYLAALGREARLLAERARAPEISFPETLTRFGDRAGVVEILDGERRLFEGRRSALESQISLLEARIAKAREERSANRRQLALIAEEIVGVRELFEKGLERKPRLLALQRAEAELEGKIAQGAQTVSETEFQMLGLLENSRSEIETELRAVQTTLEDLRSQLAATQDALTRTTIDAPETGRVYGLRFHTPGGVIAPGDPILNIVPDGEELIVRAQLDPNDIDQVKEGATATVRLTSFNQRTFKPIEGTVIQISPDVVRPEQGPPFYEARIRLDPEMLARFDITLLPGMPAMAIIATGEQTMLDYLIAPIARSLDTALREN